MPQVAEVTKHIERLLEQIEISTGQAQAPTGKRATWRYGWVASARVELDDSRDSSEPLYITTRSISAEGLDFYSPHVFERDCKVLIILETDEGELQIPATVMHSTESVGMPITGVHFDLD